MNLMQSDTMVQDTKETRRIVRILTTDIDGSLNVERALRKIRGVSFMFSKAVCIATGTDSRRKVGQLSEVEVKTLEGFIKKPQLPAWMHNRRKDPETGEDMHITMADLQLKKRDDINLLRKLRAYKGIRHELGQPVCGQRTRSSFRTQKSVGVSKKKIQTAAKPAAKPKEEKK